MSDEQSKEGIDDTVKNLDRDQLATMTSTRMPTQQLHVPTIALMQQIQSAKPGAIAKFEYNGQNILLIKPTNLKNAVDVMQDDVDQIQWDTANIICDIRHLNVINHTRVPTFTLKFTNMIGQNPFAVILVNSPQIYDAIQTAFLDQKGSNLKLLIDENIWELQDIFKTEEQ